MLRTKKEVDHHVRELLNKVKNEDDRKSRGYNIARLYFNIDEYESSRRYLSEFIALRPKSSDAHKLMGNIYEQLGQKEKAIQCYKTAYSISDKQKDLVPKICGLFAESDVDSETRTHWVEEGERLFPHHQNVIQLRQSLIMADSSQSKEDQENFYLREIKANPLSLMLHIKFGKFLMNWGADNNIKLSSALEFVINVEARKPFPYSLEWYQTVVDVFKGYEKWKKPKDDILFEEVRLSVLDRYIFQSLLSASGPALSSLCSIKDAANRLQLFGSQLLESLKIIDANSICGQHMISQYYFYLATLLSLRGKSESILHKNIYVGCAFLHSCFLVDKCKIPTSGMEDREAIKKQWVIHSQYRISQSGHILNHLALLYGSQKEFLKKVHEICSHRNTLNHIQNSAFGSLDISKKVDFFHDVNFMKKVLKFVDPKVLHQCDHDIILTMSNDLRELIWLFLQYLQPSTDQIRVLGNFQSFHIFRSIPFSSSMNTVSPETLCHLDLITFIVGVTFCQQANADVPCKGNENISYPSIMADHLFTPDQGEWWNAVASLCLNRGSKNLDRFRSILQSGLESIRHLGHHILPPVKLTLHLGRFFTKWLSEASSQGISPSEVHALGERAEHYWSKVVAHCSKKSKGILAPGKIKSKLFDIHGSSEFGEEELDDIQEEGELFIASRLDGKGKMEEAIHILSRLKSPKASFNRAMLYKKQAHSLLGNRMWQNLSLSARKDYISLLTQSRDALYLTLDRLKMPGIDSNDPLNVELSEELSSVEHCLSSVTLDEYTGAHSDEDLIENLKNVKNSQDLNLTNGNASGNGSWMTPPCDLTSHMYSTPIINRSSRTRQEARPSSERLDAQMRHLTDIQQNTIKNIEEHNAALRSQNETLIQTCQTMMSELKDRYLEQRNVPASSVDLNTPILDQLKQLEASVKNLQLDVKLISTEISDLKKNTKATQSKPDPLQLLPVGSTSTEGQVPLDMTNPALQGMYGNYMGFCGQPAVGSPLATHPAAMFNPCQPPFLPPASLQDQVYIYPSPADVLKHTMNATASIAPPVLSAYQSQQGVNKINNVVGTPKLSAPIAPPSTVPPHSFQITLPASVPPSYSNKIPASGASQTESVFTTHGLLSNIPPPVYSAIASSRSPGGKPAIVSGASPSTPGQSHPSSIIFSTPPSGVGKQTVVTSKTIFPPVQPSIQTPPSSSSKTPPSASKTSTTTTPSNKSLTDNDRYIDDGHDPRPDFKPVIPLPDPIELVTGEEDEEILFEERAKLFRFVDKEWKERGLGPIKILCNPKQQSVRVLMRREQTHKICCNHLIHSSVELNPMRENEKTWIWAAQDFADEKLTLEKFCCKFKTVEIAKTFAVAFNKGRDIAKIAAENAKVSGTKSDSTLNVAKPSTPLKPLSELFKPAEGSWTCSTCLVSNTKIVNCCASCQTIKPGISSNVSATASESNSKVSFKFGISSVASSTTSSTPPKSSSAVLTSTPKNEIIIVTPNIPKAAANSSSPITFGPNSSVSITPVKPGSTPAMSLFKDTPPPHAGAQTDSERFSMAGFTFSKAPMTIPVQDDDKPKASREDPPKNTIFSNFSFSTTNAPGDGQPAKAPFTFNFTASVTSSSAIGAPTSGIFSGASKTCGSTVSFGSLAAEKPDEANIFKTKDEKSFMPQPLFGKSPSSSAATVGARVNSTTDMNNSKEEHVEEYEPQVDFKPVVPMPDLVDVKTGEESEEQLFAERAKLFRFDTVNKEWKERGVGEVKLLLNKSTCKVRLLMRRDQIFKICANHFLTPDMALLPMPSSDKAWIWSANDFADEEIKGEKFAIRFKNVELANKFQVAFVGAQKKIGVENSKPASTPSNVIPTLTTASDKPKPLSELFKPAAGSWECSVCLVMNSSDKSACASCSTPKDGSTPPTENISQSTAAATTIFGANAQPFKFSNIPAQSSTFSFGVPASSGTSTTPSLTSATTVTGSSASKPFTFNWAPKESSTPKTDSGKSSGFCFGSPEKYEFSFSGVQAARSRDTSLCESENGVAEEEDDNLYFEPVIALPDKVDIVTGEEDEAVLYSHRAKLFRLRDGEFKERGLGDIKILKHNETGKVRLLMRREHIHKICLNHYLTKDLQFHTKDEKSFYWVATDYSEETPTKESFAIRFKTPEIAAVFHEAIERAKDGSSTLSKSPNSSHSSSVLSSTPTAVSSTEKCSVLDFEVVFEKKASKDQISRARKLQLPDNFYLFEEKARCPGCIGCPDEEDDKATKIDLKAVSSTSKLPVFGAGTPVTSASSAPSFSFGAPSAASIFGTSQSNAPGSIFGGTPQAANIFGGKSTTTTTTTNIFGGNSTSVNIFGNTSSTFGAPTTSVSIFGGGNGSSLFGQKTTSSLTSVSGAPVLSSSSNISGMFSSPSGPSISFGDLAKQGSQSPFGTSGSPGQQVDKSNVWKSKPVFASSSTTKSPDSSSQDVEAEEHDPHFEPVIPMPDIVNVTTGEEGWENIFIHRAKLYRYMNQTREWKERGIGDFKIQYEPSLDKYRLLQRREQVHKLSCNHYISPNMKMDQMVSSETAWCWLAMDFSEKPEGEAFKFAVKFKSKEIATAFKDAFDSCLKKMSSSPSGAQAAIANSIIITQPVVSKFESIRESTDQNVSENEEAEEEEVEEYHHEDDEDYEDLDEDDEDDCDEMFSGIGDVSLEVDGAWRTYSGVDVKIVYDGDAYGARIVIVSTDTGEFYVDCLIAIQTIMIESTPDSLTFTGYNQALDPPRRSNFRVSFEDKDAVFAFRSTFNEGKDYAFSSDIKEINMNEVPEEQLYYGHGNTQD